MLSASSAIVVKSSDNIVEANIAGAIPYLIRKDLFSMVAVLDTNKQILAPTNWHRAKRLLRSGNAAVYLIYPFTIILKRVVENPQLPDLKLKFDPGSKTTGVAVVDQDRGKVIAAAEIEHRGNKIKSSLDSRRATRRNRRNRKTRYRKARFDNRKRVEGRLAPSVESRVFNIETWTQRYMAIFPISGIAIESVKFDTQLMQKSEISGIEYQQGELTGYEIREFLLEKWNRKCAYCNKTDIRLQIEHIVPKSRSGSNRVSNLTVACEKCNQKKGNLTAEEFGFPQIQRQAKTPLKDAAIVNSIRWAIYERLKAFGLPVETGSGGQTKFNRSNRRLPKTHWIDAACVGLSTPESLQTDNVVPLRIKATGHGSRQMCRVDKYGFPRTSSKTERVVKGFRTGDMVKAMVSSGKKVGSYIGRVAIRITGNFCIHMAAGKVDGISHRCCRVLHKADGYQYGNTK